MLNSHCDLWSGFQATVGFVERREPLRRPVVVGGLWHWCGGVL